jgi:glyoxylase I family protein
VPILSRIAHIALTVTDLAVSLAFYEAVLSLRPVATLDDGPFTRRLLPLPGGMHLGLTQHDHGSGQPFDPTTPGLDHLAFACHSRDELVSWAQHLDARGVAHGGVQDAAYGSALSFADPDGNALELFAAAGS